MLSSSCKGTSKECKKSSCELVVTSNEETTENIKSTIKLMTIYKLKRNEDDSSFCNEGKNAWDSLNVNNIENKIMRDGSFIKLTSDKKKLH